MEAVPSEAGCETVPESPTPDAEVEQLRSVVAGVLPCVVFVYQGLLIIFPPLLGEALLSFAPVNPAGIVHFWVNSSNLNPKANAKAMA